MSEIIRDAIAQHLAQQEAEGGAFVTGFVCMAEYLDSDGDQSWLVAFPDGQTVTTSFGQAEMLHTYLRQTMDASVCGDDE